MFWRIKIDISKADKIALALKNVQCPTRCHGPAIPLTDYDIDTDGDDVDYDNYNDIPTCCFLCGRFRGVKLIYSEEYPDVSGMNIICSLVDDRYTCSNDCEYIEELKAALILEVQCNVQSIERGGHRGHC